MQTRLHRLKHEHAQGLVELIVALTVLSVGVGSLLTLLTSSALSLQRSDQKGTALVLAEKQLEIYRGVPYKDIRLDQYSLDHLSTLDPQGYYTSASSSDTSIPTASGQLTDTAPGGVTTNCPDPPAAVPVECQPVQIVTGPDNRRYRVDTYIHQENINGGDDVARVYVDVRAATNPSTILARSMSTFSSISIANVNGKAIVKLAFSAPKADITGGLIDPSQISATLSNGSGETGIVSFYVLPAPASPSSPCTGASWWPLGAVNAVGDGITYHPAGGYTPPSAGTYYWYATYSGDSSNKKAQSICGASMARMTVQASKWSPTLSVTTTAGTGIVNTLIPASAITASVAASSGTTTAAIKYMVYGPSASAPASCTTTPGGLWAPVGTLTPNGNGSYNPNTGYTPGSAGTYWYYASYPGDTTNNAASSTCGSAMAKTVVSSPPDTFGFSAVGATQNAGTQFTIGTITAQLYGGGGTDTAYTGVKTLTFSGPGTSAKGNAPTYPATVTFTNGIATNVNITLFKAETTTLTATQGLITGSSNSFTVNGGTAAGFTIDPVATQTVNFAFGVTLRTIDAYGNPAPYSSPLTIIWSGAVPAPNGTPAFYPATATALTFSNSGGQGFAIATGIKLYNAASTVLTATSGSKVGTSASFTVNAASPASMAFVNCTLGAGTCTDGPFSTGNNGTLKANVALKDTYGNVATTGSAVSVTLTSSSTGDYTVAPSPVTVAINGSQSNQFTVTPAKNNAALTTITAHATSGGYADITLQVKK